MDVKASARFIRMSPKKIRLVVDLVRGMPAQEAEKQLRFVPKAASLPVLKLLRSAIANAENNFKLDGKDLVIKEIRVDQGPTLKRWMPRAFGRASTIRKRSSHISILLNDGKAGPAVKAEVKKEAVKEEKIEVVPVKKVAAKKKAVKKTNK